MVFHVFNKYGYRRPDETARGARPVAKPRGTGSANFHCRAPQGSATGSPMAPGKGRIDKCILRLPLWPYDAIEWVSVALPRHPRVFEYGSGGSTLWLEDRGATVITAEHADDWREELASLFGPRITLLFRPPRQTAQSPRRPPSASSMTMWMRSATSLTTAWTL